MGFPSLVKTTLSMQYPENQIPMNIDVESMESVLVGRLDYSTPARSFNPWFSETGLCVEPSTGKLSVFYHYNRLSYRLVDALISPLVERGTGVDVTGNPFSIACKNANEYGYETAFFAHNAWIFEARVPNRETMTLRLCNVWEPSTSFARAASPSTWLVRGYVPTSEKRDPDPYFPLGLGVRVLAGSLQPLSPGEFKAEPDVNGRLVLSFAVAGLETDDDALETVLAASPTDIPTAVSASRRWLGETLHRLPLPRRDSPEFPVAARAALALAMNATAPSGFLKDRVVIFPNRGTYPCVFLWDSCFSNLAAEYMMPRLAPDALLVLAENLRADGMMAHFLCSTWRRPLASQPALVGWAAVRLLEQRQDAALARRLIEGLERNTEWWLRQRGGPDGLIICRDPFETGWDDTPRFDQGAIIALDMTSYVINQQRCCAWIARFLNQSERAAHWEREADRLAAALVACCYDPRTNLFYDVLLSTGEWLPLKTPAAFLPLWAGVPLPRERRAAMIRDWLLNPKYFWGSVPFPSVAFDEPSYQPAPKPGKSLSWRGPTWPSVAWLLLELLEKEGLHAERVVARDRFIELWTKDGALKELFNSRTGEGLGSYELSWTAAIFLRLLADREAVPTVLPPTTTCHSG